MYAFQIERRHASLVKSTDAMKGRVRECHSEHGRLKTEDKVCVHVCACVCVRARDGRSELCGCCCVWLVLVSQGKDSVPEQEGDFSGQPSLCGGLQ